MNLNFSNSRNEFTREITILIADDDYDSYWLISRALRHNNAKIIWAKNGAEAVSICRSNPKVDLVLMDIRMPVMNGFEATSRIKDFRKDLPVIIQTAYAKEYAKDQFMNIQFDGFIKKPVKKKQLLDLIRTHIFKTGSVIEPIGSWQ